MEDTIQELEFLDLGGLSEDEKFCLQSYLEGPLSPKSSQNDSNSTGEANHEQSDKYTPMSAESCASPAFQNAPVDHMTVPITVAYPAPAPVHVYQPDMCIATTMPQYQHMSYPMPMLSGAHLMDPNYFMGPPNPAIAHPGSYPPQLHSIMNQQQFPRKGKPPRVKYSPRREVPNGHAPDGFAGIAFPSPGSYTTPYYSGNIVQAATGVPFVMQRPFACYPPPRSVHVPTANQAQLYPVTTIVRSSAPTTQTSNVITASSPAPFTHPETTTQSSNVAAASTLPQPLPVVTIVRDSETKSNNVVTVPPPSSTPATAKPPVKREDSAVPVVTEAAPQGIQKQEPQMPVPVAVQQTKEPSSVPPLEWSSSNKSWASLFKKDVANAVASERPTARIEPFASADASVGRAAASAGSTPAVVQHPRHLAEHLSKYELHPYPLAMQPRGLINKGNWCYINATLQALVACSPFVHLMKSLIPFVRSKSTESIPIIESVLEFIEQFDTVPVKSSKDRLSSKKEDPHIGTSFEPSSIYKALSKIRSETFKVEGRQEDAEEFLSCLLNALHDEMIDVMKSTKGRPKPAESKQNGQDDDEWQVIGPKNRGCVTHTTAFSKTPISNLFLGQMRSALHYAGAQSTATLQPFFSLQLDIQSDKVKSVRDALACLVSKEPLTGYVCSKTGQEVEASRQITLEELPPILILHLKCFVYDKSGGIQKLMKRVDFTSDLELSKEFLSPNLKGKLKGGQKTYKLFAVVYHDGKEATKGHYITEIHHAGVGGWLRFDDSTVRVVDSQLFKYNPPRMPYLLLYRKLYL